jgi:hypothetical protein
MESGLFREAFRLVRILDEVYGANRDVDHGDGGFVLIAENVQDIEHISRSYFDLTSNAYEAADIVNSDNGVLLDVFVLRNNEFGINILMPVGIAPRNLLRFVSNETGNIK